ncbi:hypothetical protein BDV32DRAFT_133329 [Aspergillus pseudonomiae]|uniref:Uncharacterized protein n=1 Tax=Aspergillus pseudonomiae TaxID=1506151 RepID=A0A5N7CU05_9EURO|nr:uncharacterized protein BDV37DRAFT_266472 [Aspergillus pseudonomiae]KAB8253868.1 hypothetical protein BDV32DRAFT_133329 [Aspergillus pseudonomiae]KAE8397138.1 hypothetical protein BDV37DRAFT_266472 [Aspergillus pseudonomiae]
MFHRRISVISYSIRSLLIENLFIFIVDLYAPFVARKPLSPFYGQAMNVFQGIYSKGVI